MPITRLYSLSRAGRGGCRCCATRLYSLSQGGAWRVQVLCHADVGPGLAEAVARVLADGSRGDEREIERKGGGERERERNHG